MNLHSRSIIATAAWLASAGMAASACADGVSASHPAHHSTSPRSAPLTVAARKPNDSGVAIQFRVEGTAQPGRPISVFLQFDGVTNPAGATVRLTTDVGLTLITDKSLALPAGRRTTATAAVTSSGDGLAYLNVFVTQNGAMSIVAIPIQTGSAAPAMKPAGEMHPSADGEKVISMPAQEPKTPAKRP